LPWNSGASDQFQMKTDWT